MRNQIRSIETSVLKFRTLSETDAVIVQELLARNKEYMLPWIPWAKDEPQTIEEKAQTIREWEGSFLLDIKYVYGAFNDNELIGIAYLFTRQGPGIMEVGYIIDHQQSGKGHATLLTYAFTKLSFEFSDIEKVEIHCSPKNIASSKIPKKLGYKLECTHRKIKKDESGNREELMIWGLFREEFKPLEQFEPVTFL